MAGKHTPMPATKPKLLTTLTRARRIGVIQDVFGQFHPDFPFELGIMAFNLSAGKPPFFIT
jgi:hypothetical protein